MVIRIRKMVCIGTDLDVALSANQLIQHTSTKNGALVYLVIPRNRKHPSDLTYNIYGIPPDEN